MLIKPQCIHKVPCTAQCAECVVVVVQDSLAEAEALLWLAIWVSSETCQTSQLAMVFTRDLAHAEVVLMLAADPQAVGWELKEGVALELAQLATVHHSLEPWLPVMANPLLHHEWVQQRDARINVLLELRSKVRSKASSKVSSKVQNNDQTKAQRKV